MSAFVSYSRKDSEFALRLAQDLKAAGAGIWLDQLELKPGHPWDNAIEDALLDAQQMLVILSPESVKSENVRDEISYALRQGKTVIPVLYMECAVPLRLERKQHIDFRSDYARGLATLLTQLQVVHPNQAVLDRAAESDAQRHAAWQAREAEAQRLKDLIEQKAREQQAEELRLNQTEQDAQRAAEQQACEATYAEATHQQAAATTKAQQHQPGEEARISKIAWEPITTGRPPFYSPSFLEQSATEDESQTFIAKYKIFIGGALFGLLAVCLTFIFWPKSKPNKPTIATLNPTADSVNTSATTKNTASVPSIANPPVEPVIIPTPTSLPTSSAPSLVRELPSPAKSTPSSGSLANTDSPNTNLSVDSTRATGSTSLPDQQNLYQQAEGYRLTEHYEEARPIFERLCAIDLAKACTGLGWLYSAGAGVPRNTTHAAQLFQKGCNSGDPQGCNDLGIIYLGNQGISRDAGRAAYLFKKACDENIAVSCWQLAQLNETGDGVRIDLSRSLQLYQKACTLWLPAESYCDILKNKLKEPKYQGVAH